MRRFFSVLEEILTDADAETSNLISLGFFERLQNHASRRSHGSNVFELFMGPKSRKMWSDLQAIWASKSS